MLLARIYL